MPHPFRRAAAMLVAFLLVLPADAATRAQPPAARPPGTAIASAHVLATDAGLQVVREGGNAFDAAVAVSAALAVVEPVSSGLGGGGFFLLHDARRRKDVFVDAREVAPASVVASSYLDADGELDRDKAVNGPWSAGVPGLPAGLVHISRKYGRLPLSKSLAPAIRLAREGFPVYERLANGYKQRASVMERYAGTREVFLADGDAPEVGEILVQPDLARTLEALAREGVDGFYRGDVARRLLSAVATEGVHWSASDLKDYRIKEREPLRFEYDGWRVVTAPPPSSGGIALAQMLQMLEPWDLAKLSGPQRVHLTVEAMRRAYRDRTFYLGDPDFVQVPSALLASPEYAAGQRSTIHPDKATPSTMLSGAPTPLEGEETTHFSIIDAEGNRVAATQTVNLTYGSGFIAPGTGVLLNNEMDDFALRPGTPNAFGVMGYDANAVAPGKRMLSSMTPTFIESAEKVAVLGTPGGSRIITMVLLGILGYADGLSPQQVVALPRYHHQWLPDSIQGETGALPDSTRGALASMGHTFATRPAAADGRTSSHVWGNLQTVMWDRRSNTLEAASDPRHTTGSAKVAERRRK